MFTLLSLFCILLRSWVRAELAQCHCGGQLRGLECFLSVRGHEELRLALARPRGGKYAPLKPKAHLPAWERKQRAARENKNTIRLPAVLGPVSGLGLTSLFNQTQTHMSGQPSPTLSFPGPSCQMHTPCPLPQHSSSAFPLPHRLPLRITLSFRWLSIFLYFLCPAPCAPSSAPSSSSPLRWPPLSLRDVTLSTVR
uniref:Uncharacterized protein n=1 Tax=Knipowitschia caucasica TaxID=637954 RepID=A0AAV2J496_KNICA